MVRGYSAIIAAVFAVAMTSPAVAQQSSTERALINKLMLEINTGLACNKQVIDLQTENEDLKKQIEASKPKPEKK